MRGQMTAIYFLALNLAGIGLGPTVVALLTEKLFQNDAAVGWSNATVTLIAAPISAFLLWRAVKPYERHLANAAF